MGDMEYGLIGERLEHSFSPAIHRQLAGYDYRLMELSPAQLGPFLERGEFRGLNVTIPYKKAVIPYCRELTARARHIGSVNTILRQTDGALLGENTDYDGFLYQLQAAGISVTGRKVLVLGSGGAAATVHAVLKDLGAGEAVSISRSGPDSYDTLARHADGQVLVNTTPVGMYPNTGVSPVNLQDFPALEGVLDLIYNPIKTQLLLQAEKRGIPCSNGLGMLVAQARAAAGLFLGAEIPARRVGELVRDIEKQKRNLLLVGMPGSGKTTVGQELAQRLGRQLADTDELVERQVGCTIPELFAQAGEEAFRKLEHEALCRVSGQSGLVIATGGGVVTREENINPMRQNSTVIFLRRSIDQLPVEGRPLSQAGELEQLYRRRLPLYEGVADLTVDNHTPQGAAQEIIRRLAL